MIHLHLFHWNRNTLPVVFRCHVLIWLVNVMCKRRAGRRGRGVPPDGAWMTWGNIWKCWMNMMYVRIIKGESLSMLSCLPSFHYNSTRILFFFYLLPLPLLMIHKKRVKTQIKNPVLLCRSLLHHASIKQSIHCLQTKMMNLISTAGTRHLFSCRAHI